jgi:hypothetical protein
MLQRLSSYEYEAENANIKALLQPGISIIDPPRPAGIGSTDRFSRQFDWFSRLAPEQTASV